ncbi:hypothetical protein AWR27_21755 [Spirosoma montaniterrae]|uniref:Acyltransferase 3 domain-containing protein n=2 Tax=Spirosoma montaniterrae TaxID=1178516 RepID=A0A1P9X238_9BACT|nr:hypothetical protein AWR27_21755 [Spirosoma montaniterrae]
MIAMFSIVVVHCVAFPPLPDSVTVHEAINYPIFNLMTEGQATAMLIYSQFLRFGSIHFFIVSGYLLGRNLTNYPPAHYYRRRLSTILLPFSVAFLIFCFKSIAFHRYTYPAESLDTLIAYVGEKLVFTLFHSPFWFVPNYFLSLAILLLCRAHLHKTWFAALLIGINILYGINVHLNLVASRHNLAVLGFVFFLWLGYTIARTKAISRSIQMVSYPVLAGITVFCFAGAVVEGLLLMNKQAGDPLNSIRITNQLFAISLFFLLARTNLLRYLPFMKPRQESFGIYLYHMFAVNGLIRLANGWKPLNALMYQPHYTGLTLIGISLFWGILSYILTLLFVKAVVASRFSWVMGVNTR